MDYNCFISIIGESLATRAAYGNAIVKIAKNNDRVVALDGDMKNSTFSQNLRKVFPERHVECFICEQNLAGVSIKRYNNFVEFNSALLHRL